MWAELEGNYRIVNKLNIRENKLDTDINFTDKLKPWDFSTMEMGPTAPDESADKQCYVWELTFLGKLSLSITTWRDTFTFKSTDDNSNSNTRLKLLVS